VCESFGRRGQPEGHDDRRRAEVDMTQADWQVAVAAAYVVSGWYPSVEEVDLVLMNENELLRAAAAKLPIGTAVECRDGVLAARKPPQNC
jgi:hypothetical protein